MIDYLLWNHIKDTLLHVYSSQLARKNSQLSNENDTRVTSTNGHVQFVESVRKCCMCTFSCQLNLLPNKFQFTLRQFHYDKQYNSVYTINFCCASQLKIANINKYQVYHILFFFNAKVG